MNLEEKLKILEELVVDLQNRIQQLEQTRHVPIPKPFTEPFQVSLGCTVCGIKFNGPMGYCCTNPKCPSGVAYCSVEY